MFGAITRGGDGSSIFAKLSTPQRGSRNFGHKDIRSQSHHETAGRFANSLPFNDIHRTGEKIRGKLRWFVQVGFKDSSLAVYLRLQNIDTSSIKIRCLVRKYRLLLQFCLTRRPTPAGGPLNQNNCSCSFFPGTPTAAAAVVLVIPHRNLETSLLLKPFVSTAAAAV